VGNRWLLPRTQGSTIKTDRRKIVRPTDFQFCLEIHRPEPIILAPGPLPGGFFPYAIFGRLWPLATQVTRHLCENALPFAIAGSLAPELAIEVRLGTDHEDDARHLHPHMQPVRVELVDRP
jgi:hypothetical protein